MNKVVSKLNKGPQPKEEQEYKHPVTGEDVGALLFGIHHHYPSDEEHISKKDSEKIFYFEEDLLPILKALGLPEPIWGKSKTLDEFLDDSESAWFQSEDFKTKIRKRIEDDTWGKGKPMIYMDEEGWLVEHWEDGRIIRKKKLQ